VYKLKLGFPGKANTRAFNNLDTALPVYKNQKNAWMDLGICGDHYFYEVPHYSTFSIF